MFLGSRSYQTSVSVWRETNQLPRLRFSPARYFVCSDLPGASSSKGRLRTSTFLGAGTANSVVFARWLSEQQKNRWWFQIFFCSQPRSVGKWFNFTNMFQMDWNHQLETLSNDGGDGLIESEKSLWKKWWVGWICFVSVMRVEKILRAWNPTS